MEDYGTTGAKTDSELFRHAEQWLTNNPNKNTGHYRKQFGIKKLLKPRQRKGKPILIGWKGKSADAQAKRINNLTYASKESYDARQIQKAQHATDIGIAKKAGYDMFEEHLTAADQYFKFGHPSQGSDDVGNVRLRFTENKTSKDVMEDLSKRWHLPWATTLNDADETLVVNELEWLDHDYGHTLDLNAGVTMSDAEVRSWDNFLSTGDLGDLDEKKARYLMQEYGGKSGNLDELRYKFIANVNNAPLKQGAILSKKMQRIMSQAEKAKSVLKTTSKAAKPLNKALRYVPVVGSGMVLLNAKAQAEEAIENPTWQNKVQAAIAGFDTTLEGIELATSGVGGLITTPLQIGLMIADQMIHQTEDEFERPTYDYASRRRYRTGRS